MTPTGALGEQRINLMVAWKWSVETVTLEPGLEKWHQSAEEEMKELAGQRKEQIKVWSHTCKSSPLFRRSGCAEEAEGGR